MTGSGGKGILLTSLPGIPSPDVVIVGGGIVGRNAARQFLALGCTVIVLDTSRTALERIDEMFQGRVETLLGTPANLERVVRFADVLVCCAFVPDSPAPRIITREMVKKMKPRSLIIDVAIDHGGMCETSRPTTLEFPTFIAEDVVHYCVPNNASMCARTASVYIDNTLHRYLLGIHRQGAEPYITAHKGLAQGLIFYKGVLVNKRVAQSLNTSFMPLEELLQGED
jgi:alanine dehydrogenase